MSPSLDSIPNALPRAGALDTVIPQLLNGLVVAYLTFVVAIMLFDEVLGPARWLP